MSAPAKFLFDHDFKAPTGSKPGVMPAEHEAKLAEADAGGFARGLATARAETEARTAAALERGALKLEELMGSFAGVEARLTVEAIEVAVAAAKKLAPALVAREPLAEISDLAANCFSQLVAAPHVVIRVNETQHASVSKELEEIVRARGLASHLVVIAEPEIAPGDCRIEWADGGIIRDATATAAVIDETVGRYIEARRIAAGI